jgi:sulfite exporter TauE/SafE
MAFVTGSSLIWFGLVQVAPGILPKIPLLNPMAQGGLHDRLSGAMVRLSLHRHWWTPFLLGMAWGLIPCGFLYAAQLKAAETGSLITGAATMVAFGLGTFPLMLGVGASVGMATAQRRSQLFRLGGWVTLLIGILTLLRTGDTMVDYSGHGALICLLLALAARPLSRIWSGPMAYRRLLGVGAFIFSLAHIFHMVEHSWGWNWQAVAFMLPQHQWGIKVGIVALVLMAPAAFTSFDRAQKRLGPLWRRLHLLSVPALICAALHTLLLGSHYLGRLQLTWVNWGAMTLLGLGVSGVLLLRCRWVWRRLGLGKWYGSSTLRD